MAKKKKVIRSVNALQGAYVDGTLDPRLWAVCVDAGRCYLRFKGDEDIEPSQPPVELQLGRVEAALVEAFAVIGIPAEEA